MDDTANNIAIISISSGNVILYRKENSDCTTFPNILIPNISQRHRYGWQLILPYKPVTYKAYDIVNVQVYVWLCEILE